LGRAIALCHSWCYCRGAADHGLRRPGVVAEAPLDGSPGVADDRVPAGGHPALTGAEFPVSEEVPELPTPTSTPSKMDQDCPLPQLALRWNGGDPGRRRQPHDLHGLASTCSEEGEVRGPGEVTWVLHPHPAGQEPRGLALDGAAVQPIEDAAVSQDQPDAVLVPRLEGNVLHGDLHMIPPGGLVWPSNRVLGAQGEDRVAHLDVPLAEDGRLRHMELGTQSIAQLNGVGMVSLSGVVMTTPCSSRRLASWVMASVATMATELRVGWLGENPGT